MKLLNNVLLTVFVKGGEDETKITEKLKSFVPLDFEAEKLAVKRTVADGFSETKIIILEIELQKEKHTNIFLRKLDEILGKEQKGLVLRQAETRLDGEFNFFIRFDKEKLLNEGRYWITDSGSCFHVKMNIACFPRKKEQAMKIIQNIFK
jgi:hypothetical protein